MSEPAAPKCPDCGAPMLLRTTRKYTYGNGEPRKFYGCSNYPDCRGTHGAHPDGRPLGTPADSETKRMRMAAHKCLEIAFGSWHDREAKQAMYEWLETRRDIPKHHIGEMTKSEALDVIGALIGDTLISSAQADSVLEKTLSA